MTVVDRIKEISKKHGWNLKTTAAKAGLGENTIYGWKNFTPSSDKLQAVADVLNVSVDYLLGNTDNPATKSDESADGTAPVDLAGTNIFTYHGLPISEDDWAIIKPMLEAAAKRNKEKDGD